MKIGGPLIVRYHEATEFVVTVTKGAGYARDQYTVLLLPRNVRRAVTDDYGKVVRLSDQPLVLDHVVDPNVGPSTTEYHYHLFGVTRTAGIVGVTFYASAPDPDYRNNFAAATIRVR